MEVHNDDSDRLAQVAQALVNDEALDDDLIGIAKQAIDRAVELDPDWQGYRFLQIQINALAGNAAAVDEGVQYVSSFTEVSPMAVNNTAWFLLDNKRIAQLYDKQGLALAERANELTNASNPVVLDTLAFAKYRNGFVEEAVRLQEKAMTAFPGDPKMKQRLELYRNALSLD